MSAILGAESAFTVFRGKLLSYFFLQISLSQVKFSSWIYGVFIVFALE